MDLADSLQHRATALTVSDLASLLNISERQVYKLAADRRIPMFQNRKFHSIRPGCTRGMASAEDRTEVGGCAGTIAGTACVEISRFPARSKPGSRMLPRLSVSYKPTEASLWAPASGSPHPTNRSALPIGTWRCARSDSARGSRFRPPRQQPQERGRYQRASSSRPRLRRRQPASRASPPNPSSLVLVHADTSVHSDLLNSRFGYVSIFRARRPSSPTTCKARPQLGADISKTSALEISEPSSIGLGIGIRL